MLSDPFDLDASLIGNARKLALERLDGPGFANVEHRLEDVPEPVESVDVLGVPLGPRKTALRTGGQTVFRRDLYGPGEIYYQVEP